MFKARSNQVSALPQNILMISTAMLVKAISEKNIGGSFLIIYIYPRSSFYLLALQELPGPASIEAVSGKHTAGVWDQSLH